MRKAASVSTLGVVGYHSRCEAQRKAALQEAKLAKAQCRALKHELRDEEQGRAKGEG
jgi:hypothetical protein